MQVPSEITFHSLPHSDSVELSIERWIARLDLDQITRCDVVLGKPDKHHRDGRPLDVTVQVEVVDAAPIISHTAHENVYVAIADAFRAARRQLLDRVGARSRAA
ncbi:MAG: HPF/RaiA family ribosome-associated protein [Kofleriaceae bacterium]